MRFLLPLIFLVSFHAYAINTVAIEQQAEKEIRALYNHPQLPEREELSQRIDWFSRYFIGRPYILFPLGEGVEGTFDNNPRYRVDGFDCLTYVETVLALALAHDFSSFEQMLLKLRYAHGEPDYLKRNHFTSLDWNRNNADARFIEDTTPSIVDSHHRQVAQKAMTVIDKAKWFQFKSEPELRTSSIHKKQRVHELHQRAKQFLPQQVEVLYIPLTVLFDANGQPDASVFDQIPHTAIIELVRPDWAIEKKIGTRLHISHLGFAIRKQGQLYFREASSQQKKVQDSLLTEYLKNTLKSPTIKGINIQMPKKHSK